MKKNVVILIVILLLLFTTVIFSGCVRDLYATGDEPDTTEKIKEKTQEEIQKEKETEEQRKLAEEQRKREEREKKEQALKEQLGPFYVPLPPEEQTENPPVKARGIYVTGNSVGLKSRYAKLLELVETTELNAMVIDVKNDHGLMSYPSQIEIVQQVDANYKAPIKNIKEELEDLKQRNIYPIARIVVFKDPNLPEKKPEWALQKKTGGVWRDRKGIAWVNPYEKKVWDYNIAIAKEAALMGFREIQFDYIRFPENARRVDAEVDYNNNGVSKDEIIEEFLQYAREQLKDYNVHISADVFGVIATSWGDSDKIGQTWERMTSKIEYISPMIYPSHYGPGYFGYKVPDAHPAGTIRSALIDSIERNAAVEEPGIIRPWLQSFTATWVPGYISYGPEEVRQQIDAALALGIDEYLIWSASNRYYPESFRTEEEYQRKAEQYKKQREESGQDVLGRTSIQALEDLLKAFSKKDWRDAFVLHANDFSFNFTNYQDWMDSWTGKLNTYEIKTDSTLDTKGTYAVDLSIKRGEEEIKLVDQSFEVYKENNIWRVKPSVELITMLTKEIEPEAKEIESESQEIEQEAVQSN